ncbi:MAG: PRC-barrel domain-containing protein [Ferruginibacter sp.]
MQRSINSLLGFTIGATDGEIGKVEDFYFDDSTWTIRYIIVKTGGWLTERKILISPEAILHRDWDNKVLPANLTRKQVEESPDIDTDKPISRQQEDELFAYYPWQSYYDAGLYGDGIGMMSVFPIPPILEEGEKEEEANKEKKKHGIETHLRSTHELKGYTIHATDGEIGEVSDFLFDEDAWNITFVVVKTGSLFSKKKVLLSPAWIKDVKWDLQELIVNVTMDKVEHSPEYDSSKPLEMEDATELHNYYSRDKDSPK